jgi:hypothetical protein
MVFDARTAPRGGFNHFDGARPARPQFFTGRIQHRIGMTLKISIFLCTLGVLLRRFPFRLKNKRRATGNIFSTQLSVLRAVMQRRDGRGHSGFAMVSRLWLSSVHAFPGLLRGGQRH